jgi:hypothetical protein
VPATPFGLDFFLTRKRSQVQTLSPTTLPAG